MRYCSLVDTHGLQPLIRDCGLWISKPISGSDSAGHGIASKTMTTADSAAMCCIPKHHCDGSGLSDSLCSRSMDADDSAVRWEGLLGMHSLSKEASNDLLMYAHRSICTVRG